MARESHTGQPGGPDKTPIDPEALKASDQGLFTTPDHLRMISQSRLRFSLAFDERSPHAAYTDLQTGVIYRNPEAWMNFSHKAREGLLYHEAGHHAPPVVQFQDRMLHSLSNRDIIPDAYQGDPNAETRFLRSIQSHLQNALADVWLESYMGRGRYLPPRERLDTLYGEIGQRDSLRQLPKPDQLIQFLVGEARYGSKVPLNQLIDPEVAQAYQRIETSGAFKVLQDSWDFVKFSTPQSQDRAVERKFQAYQQVFLPEYLKLMEAELEERKQQKQQSKGQSGQGTPQQGEGGSSPSDSVPLTKEEEQELIDQILSELEQAGKELESHANSGEKQKEKDGFFDKIKERLKDRQERLKEGKPLPREDSGEQKGKKGEDALRDIAEQLQQQDQDRRQRGLADSMGVRQESVQTWEATKQKYKMEIESAAAAKSEIFLEDRRARMEYLKREGEVVPGLEYETVSAYYSGDLDPDTKMRSVRNPEFIELEEEFIVDTSGSMSGTPLERTIETIIVDVESSKRTKELLEEENLVADGEDPLRIGVTKYSTTPRRVTPLDEPLSDKKELEIVDKLSMVGGGTDEAESVKQVYEGLRLRQPNVVKIITLITDGYGNAEAVAPMLKQIEEDKEVLFFMAIVGNGQADYIVNEYLKFIPNREESNVVAHGFSNPADLMPAYLAFLKRTLSQRRSY